MNIDGLQEYQLNDVRRRVRRNQGALVDVPYETWTEGTNAESGEAEETVAEGIRTFFIGRLNPDNTVPVLAAMGMIFFAATEESQKARAAVQAAADAADEAGGDIDFADLIKYIKGAQLINLVSAILEEDPAWVRENWEVAAYLKALGVFFKKNRFFAVLQEAMELMTSLGLSAEDTAA